MTAQSPRPLDSLTSSAKLLTSKSLGKGGLRAQSESWHDDAWNMYDLVGELHFLVTNIANRMSQARFYVGTLPDEQTDDPEETTDEQLGEILSAVGGGGSSSDLTQLVNRLGANLFVAGDGWLVGIPRGLLDENSSSPGAIENLQDASLDDLDWRMLSTNEVTQASGGQVRLLLDHNQQVETGIDNLFLIRVWRPHPRKVWESDSPVRAGMPILRELVGLTMHISAQVDSRLAGAGLIAVPSSAVQAMRQQRGLTEDDPEDPFTDALMEAMLKPIEDRSSASAVVPLVASVPDESADKIKHLTFSTELDANAKELREEAIRRLALSLDCPPELLLGQSGMNHWGAWLIREEVISTHIEPPLALICDALTQQYLRPMMIGAGYSEEEAARHVIWYDVSHLIMRPNRADDAERLYQAGELSGDAYRRALNFEEDDAPAQEESELTQAQDAALDMIKNAPSLAQDPGIVQLAQQIQDMLDGKSADESSAPAPESGEQEPEPTESPDDGGPPQSTPEGPPMAASGAWQTHLWNADAWRV